MSSSTYISPFKGNCFRRIIVPLPKFLIRTSETTSFLSVGLHYTWENFKVWRSKKKIEEPKLCKIMTPKVTSIFIKGVDQVGCELQSNALSIN